MQYITLITRHHDGFSDWDTKQSEWKITNTDWKQDAVKLIADECHQQGIKLFVYYSLLDWTAATTSMKRAERVMEQAGPQKATGTLYRVYESTANGTADEYGPIAGFGLMVTGTSFPNDQDNQISLRWTGICKRYTP